MHIITHLSQQGNAPTTFLTARVTLWHYITTLTELLCGELQAISVLDEEQDEGAEHQQGGAIEDRLPGIELGN